MLVGALLKHADNNDLGLQISRRTEPKHREHQREVKMHQQVEEPATTLTLARARQKG